MNVQELYDQFRDEVMDTAKPYFWSDREVFSYMDDAYKMFVRLTGGIADFTSDRSRVNIVAGKATSTLWGGILRIMSAEKVSNGGKIEIINQTDMSQTRDNDYGRVRPIYNDSTPGIVRYMVIGQQRGICRWVQVPEADDVAQLSIYRLPATKIDGTDTSFDFDEIGEEHITHLSIWMKHRAYKKADADTFGTGRADDFKAEFTDYCSMAKAEWERAKTKVRIVNYGGL